MPKLKQFIEARWYGSPGVLWLLWPLTLVYRLVHFFLSRMAYSPRKNTKPVVVVGNINVGGTGKTPIIIALVRELQQLGYSPVVISKGYGRSPSAPDAVIEVTESKSAREVGDEPLEIYQSTGCCVLVGGMRTRLIEYAEGRNIDIILCDDGLQDNRISPNYRLAIVDGFRGFGNQHVLPVGPLREPISRLKQVDHVIINGGDFEPRKNIAYSRVSVEPVTVHNLYARRAVPVSDFEFSACPIAACGLGNPQKFTHTIERLGFQGKMLSFDDHHAFSAADFESVGEQTLLMTMKDAAKCRVFAKQNWWALEVRIQLPPAVIQPILSLLRS